ncbi:MAG TPA: GNAT family N-acetyltransferase [Thermoplasmata archaeon]|nr:GNAT family N-acetyltransferase [Thermoplasmata archaeon]
MGGWTDDRIWDAVDAWKWIPPGSKRTVRANFELAVTPGSYALTYAYGLHAPDGPSADAVLAELRREVEALGGTGVRTQITPRSRPADLAERMRRAGFRVAEEAEVLAWELRDDRGRPRLPDFRAREGVTVREALTDSDYDGFLSLSGLIFGDPTPSVESQAAFKKEFYRMVQVDGHSDRFVAWEGTAPIGRAGMEVAGEVARLWGTGVLPERRQRGVYGLLVQARCEEALRRGATLALVTARVGTSGPILKHHGFRSVGPLRVLEARW